MFRVSVRGKFDSLTEAQRTTLRTENDQQNLAFTEAGTFTFDASMAVFTFRVQIPATPDDDEDVASELALETLRQRGYPFQTTKVAVTDMRDIKVNRKGR
jgi:Family of unknown function (DUF6204)